ncbi:MAG TPA: putative N-acetylmannosamine-6-phosphate 2-epimerase [Fimbriimonadaceae bacterium]|jgi:N-acetylmannosamine-6-phosphate 2-epimerase/N-acetylmannosamine kinase
MNANFLLSQMGLALKEWPLIASVQAGEHSPLEDPFILLASARASLQQGVKILRLEGVANITHIRAETGAQVMGLIKRRYAGSDVYITPTIREVNELLETGCQAIALDGTDRIRPNGEALQDLIKAINEAGRIAVADIDSVESAKYAVSCGAEVVGTTLAGYTGGPTTLEPDIELVRACVKSVSVPVFGEGRYGEKWQIDAALRAGAAAVVVGGAINDPVKNTKRLLPTHPIPKKAGAIDIGGTWLRAASFTPDDLYQEGFEPQVERIKLPPTRKEKLDWIGDFLKKGNFERVGISTGGVVKNNIVTISKSTMPENVGTDFSVLGSFIAAQEPKVVALDDGHATAWAHACHPDYAGKNIAVLTIGTGVGFGFVKEGRIEQGPGGEYTRINDSLAPNGETYEELLGGLFLTPHPSEEQKKMANQAIGEVFRLVTTFLFPDLILVSGTVGMQSWLNLELQPKEGFPVTPIIRSPFGADAGIFGAAAVALYPPPQ